MTNTWQIGKTATNLNQCHREAAAWAKYTMDMVRETQTLTCASQYSTSFQSSTDGAVQWSNQHAGIGIDQTICPALVSSKVKEKNYDEIGFVFTSIIQLFNYTKTENDYHEYSTTYIKENVVTGDNSSY